MGAGGGARLAPPAPGQKAGVLRVNTSAQSQNGRANFASDKRLHTQAVVAIEELAHYHPQQDRSFLDIATRVWRNRNKQYDVYRIKELAGKLEEVLHRLPR